MSIVSLNFLLFCMALVIVYYIIPKKYQWWTLLIASMYFYYMTGIKNMFYILVTSGSTFLATLKIEQLAHEQKAWIKEHRTTATKEEKAAYKDKNKTQRKRLLVLTLVLNFGIMCTFKYVHFAIAQLNHVIDVFHGQPLTDSLKFIIPLGISFYTFQTMGYLVDVYWEKVPAEKNYFKVLLFVSFFPQMTQGPISNFKDLTDELFAEHYFDYHNFSWGIQRMFWGFFKKQVIANVTARYVNNVFTHYSEYSGIATLLGAFMYSIQIYADFSGYMDIVCGLCEVMGIRLTENFMRPYFSKSIAEYWRRWHASLGAWFKTYIYYPIAVAKWNQNIGKSAKKKFGKTFGQTVPASIALVVVWLATGLWHGASWGYIAWGGVNGLFIIFSLWMDPVYEKWREKLNVDVYSFRYRAFQTIRTFTLVTFIKVLPEVGGLRDGLGLWKHIFTDHSITLTFGGLFPFVGSLDKFVVAMIGVLLMFITSLIQRQQPIRQWLENRTNYYVRIGIFAVMFVIIILYGVDAGGMAGGFMYAQF